VGTKRKGSPVLLYPPKSSAAAFNPFSIDDGSSGAWRPPEIAVTPRQLAPQHSTTASQESLSQCAFPWHDEHSQAGFVGSQSSTGLHVFTSQSQLPMENSAGPLPLPATHLDRLSGTYVAPKNRSQPLPSHNGRPLEVRQLSAGSDGALGLGAQLSSGWQDPEVGYWQRGRGEGPLEPGATCGGLQGGQGCSGVYPRRKSAGHGVGGVALGRGSHGAYRVRSGGTSGGRGKFHPSDAVKASDWPDANQRPGDASNEVPSGCMSDTCWSIWHTRTYLSWEHDKFSAPNAGILGSAIKVHAVN